LESPNPDRKSLRVVGPIPDMVYGVLKEAGSPLFHKDITTKLAEMLNGPDAPFDAKLVARIHTEINLDNRFVHTGQGMWGLKEWAPKRALPQKSAAGAAAKAKVRRQDFWRPDDDLEEHPRAEEEESDWPKEEEETDRPEA
jgi:DNA-directed RNA polymerase subunit delta